MSSAVDVALILCSALGFIISTYFTAIAYRWLAPDTDWIPNFCRLGERTCASIVFTPRARILGPPNSSLAQIFYVTLLVGVPLGILEFAVLSQIYLITSLGTVGLGLYLCYSLLFITRVRCLLCFTSHGLNAIIFLLLLLRETL